MASQREMHLLIKYGYDGTKFEGFDRSNSKNSVESVIINVLSEYNITKNIESAARTDKNVSAAGNVFYIKTEERPEKILGILNGNIKNMFFHSYYLSNSYINPRYNSMKIYKYIIPYRIDSRLKNNIARFLGTHDFTNFSKNDYRNPVRTINKIEFEEYNDFTVVNFYGKSFVWHQLRSIMGFAMHSDEDPFSIKYHNRFLAEPEPLILYDIIYDNISFIKYRFDNRYIKNKYNSLFIESIIYRVFLRSIDV
ncbi:pseudouridine synthase family protein [Picrophilus oshimae]|uniref:tRNA pseudouridine synthase A n=1 Tax=Picrophilus torridus (strain ATCC 700027 / DSM 9790 / JCM 10055 / NBRC 100828 / KAW 2/3) TaxID=1122961 RepID=A0A8G2FVQ0_PICTO|nr:tRNA pseudouridine(38-40) synthase TruA [Picrophilus oshimae]SMD30326.1 tRNA pseudouridine38-40 synthase [Picrophilus oshimae DSM 9789]